MISARAGAAEAVQGGGLRGTLLGLGAFTPCGPSQTVESLARCSVGLISGRAALTPLQRAGAAAGAHKQAVSTVARHLAGGASISALVCTAARDNAAASGHFQEHLTPGAGYGSQNLPLGSGDAQIHIATTRGTKITVRRGDPQRLKADSWHRRASSSQLVAMEHGEAACWDAEAGKACNGVWRELAESVVPAHAAAAAAAVRRWAGSCGLVQACPGHVSPACRSFIQQVGGVARRQSRMGKPVPAS